MSCLFTFERSKKKRGKKKARNERGEIGELVDANLVRLRGISVVLGNELEVLGKDGRADRLLSLRGVSLAKRGLELLKRHLLRINMVRAVRRRNGGGNQQGENGNAAQYRLHLRRGG